MQGNTNTDDLDLTVAERAELEGDAAEAAGKAAAAAAPADDEAAKAAAAAAAAAEAPDPNAELRTIAHAAVTAAASVAESAAKIAAGAAPKAEVVAAAQEPDWEAERKALRAKLDGGQIDDETYDRLREDLSERRVDYRADQRAQQLVEKRLQEHDQRSQEQQWNSAFSRFSVDAENKAFLADATRAAAFNAVLQAVAHETPNATYEEMLAETMSRSRAAFGLKPAVAGDANKKIEQALNERKAAAAKAPANLNGAPAAGMPGAGAGEEALDAMDIDSLEDTLAKMSADKVEAYLASAPGGLRDNPRGGKAAA